MAERTTRGDEDRKKEDEEMTTGAPVGAGIGDGAQPANTTRDKGIPPATDARRDAPGTEEE
ncbi:MAG TPA: hypothetical protein VGE74_07415 [Gemmata sp.]